MTIGMQDLIEQHKPAVILVEVYPGLLSNTLFPGGLEAVMRQLVSAGYTRGQHMGYASALRLSAVQLLPDFRVNDHAS